MVCELHPSCDEEAVMIIECDSAFIECPQCQEKNVNQAISPFVAVASKKS